MAPTSPRPELQFTDDVQRQQVYAWLADQAEKHRPRPVVLPADMLTGPADGAVDVPGYLGGLVGHQDPYRPYELVDDDARRSLYEVVLTHGTAEDVATLVNAGDLVRLWPTLQLPYEVRHAWAREWQRDAGPPV